MNAPHAELQGEALDAAMLQVLENIVGHTLSDEQQRMCNCSAVTSEALHAAVELVKVHSWTDAANDDAAQYEHPWPAAVKLRQKLTEQHW